MVPARSVLLDAGRIGFALAGFYGDIPPGVRMSFSSPSVNNRFEGFKGFIDGRENDTDFLEIAASFHFLETGGGLPRGEALRRVVGKRPQFTEEGCREVRSRLVESGILGGGGGLESGPGGLGDGCAYGAELECDPAAFVPRIPDDMDRRPYDQEASAELAANFRVIARRPRPTGSQTKNSIK